MGEFDFVEKGVEGGTELRGFCADSPGHGPILSQRQSGLKVGPIGEERFEKVAVGYRNIELLSRNVIQDLFGIQMFWGFLEVETGMLFLKTGGRLPKS